MRAIARCKSALRHELELTDVDTLPSFSNKAFDILPLRMSLAKNMTL